MTAEYTVRYVLTSPPRPEAVERTTHVIRRKAEWGMDGLYMTLCGSWKRGNEVDGPTSIYPLCPRCETNVQKGRHLL